MRLAISAALVVLGIILGGAEISPGAGYAMIIIGLLVAAAGE